MSEKTATRDLKHWNYEQGNRLAREAETGSIDNVNRQLQQVRGQLTAKEYNDLINSIQSANTARVAQDRYDLEGKKVKSLTVPTLILSDSPLDKDKLPDHVSGRNLVDGRRETFAEPKTDTSKASGAAKIDQRMKETGNYGTGWGEGAADAAFRHVRNLKGN